MMPNPPWLIRRDELHLLEEGFDDLMQRHEKQRDDAAWEAEEIVWREYARTEEESEHHMVSTIGTGWMEEHKHEHHHQHEGEGLMEVLRRESVRDPLYARAAAWGAELVRWADRTYRTAESRTQDLYRVCVFAPLVPIKISYALSESGSEGPYTKALVDKELSLALRYVVRTRESLERLQVPSRIEGLRMQAAALEEELRTARRRLEQGRERPL
jgi:hypothetical protein